jgi:hypothetical protein
MKEQMLKLMRYYVELVEEVPAQLLEVVLVQPLWVVLGQMFVVFRDLMYGKILGLL